LILAFAAVYVIWGSTYLGIKYAIESMPPFLMAGFRFVIAGGGLMIWALATGAKRPSRAHWLSSAVISALLFLGGNAGVVWAEQTIPSGLADLLVATEPLWIVLLNWALPGGKPPKTATIIGLLIGFLGVWLLLGYKNSRDFGAEGFQIAGALIVILASISWA